MSISERLDPDTGDIYKQDGGVQVSLGYGGKSQELLLEDPCVS